MPRPPVPIPCGQCGGLATRITEQDPDPEYRGGPTVWRVRICLDCLSVDGTAEVRVDLREVRRRLNELARARYYDRRPAGDVLSSPA